MRNAFQAKEDYVKVLGRTLMKNGIRYLNYSCSAIEFEFTGTKAEAVLTTDSPTLPEENKAWATIFINDEELPAKRFKLDKEEATYILYENDFPKKTRIRLVKYSEGFTGKIGIKSIIVDSESALVPTDYKPRKLEFIGDSITCGFGDEGICDVDNFTAAQENPWEAYAAKTARALDADYHLVSWSGIGILSNHTENDEPNEEWLMTDLYPYTDKHTDLYLNSSRLEEWDFGRFVPDCIVVNLGTNDNSYTKNIPERVEAFGDVYYRFIKSVRLNNPKAVILCTLGAMGQELFPEIERQVSKLNQEGDGLVYSMAFDVQSEEDGIATYWHPSLKTHAKMADKLASKVKEVMKW